MFATNIRKTLQIIKGILNKNEGTAITEHLKSNGKLITDKKEVADIFNEYFCNIVPTLAKQIPPPTLSHTAFLKWNYKESSSLFITKILLGHCHC